MFGRRNPQKVAEKQLNQAKLDLMEVSSELESRIAQKSALEARITRLQATVEAERAEQEREEDRENARTQSGQSERAKSQPVRLRDRLAASAG